MLMCKHQLIFNLQTLGSNHKDMKVPKSQHFTIYFASRDDVKRRKEATLSVVVAIVLCFRYVP